MAVIQFTKLFQPQQLGNVPASATLVYTIPTNTQGTVLQNGRIRLTNTTAGVVTATMYAVPAGGAINNANGFFPTMSIRANDYVDTDLPQMAAGDQLFGYASAATAISVAAMNGNLVS